MYLLILFPCWVRNVRAWLFNEGSLTSATWALVLATVGLLIATALLVRDGYRKSREQQDRWKREDLLRAEAAKPKATVELAKRKNDPRVIVLCYNLGEHPFVIDKVTVAVENRRHISDLFGPHVVLPGTYVPVPLDCTDLFSGKQGGQYASVTFRLKGATDSVDTEPKWFKFFPEGASGYGWGIGGPSDSLPGMIVQQPRMIPDEDHLIVTP